MNKFDQTWKQHYDLYKEYVNEYKKIPTVHTIYQKFALGSWYLNQLRRYQDGKLQAERIEMMNEIIPGWDVCPKEKGMLNRQIILQSNWKEKVPHDRHSIDMFIKDESELCHWIKEKVYDCESWLDKWGIYYDIEKVKECILIIYPDWNPNYISLLLDMYMENESYLDALTRINKSCVFADAKDMKHKMELAIENLKENQQQVIRLRYGIDDGKNRHGPEISKILNISREWERRLKISSLDILRNHSQLLSCTNTELDNVFTVPTKSYLIDRRIITIKEAVESNMIENEKVKNEIQKFRDNLIELRKESLDCIVIEKFKNNVNLSFDDIENIPEHIKNEKLVNMRFPLKGCNALKDLGIETFYEFLLYTKKQQDRYSLSESINVITAHEMYCRAEEILGIDMDVKKLKRIKHIVSFIAHKKIPLEKLKLSLKTENALKRAGLEDINSVIRRLNSDLDSFTMIRGLGLKGLSEIITATQKYMQDKPYIEKQNSDSQNLLEPNYQYNDKIKLSRAEQLAERLQYCILEKRDQVFYVHVDDSSGTFMGLEELCDLIEHGEEKNSKGTDNNGYEV